MTLTLAHSRLPQPVPAYEHRPCHVCGATTEAEAGTLCISVSDQTGEANCVGGAEEESFADGRLRFITGDYLVALDAWIGQEVEADLFAEFWRGLPA